LLDLSEPDCSQAQAASDLLIQGLDGCWVQRSLLGRETLQNLELDTTQP
jgi:hypothetical protein